MFTYLEKTLEEDIVQKIWFGENISFGPNKYKWNVYEEVFLFFKKRKVLGLNAKVCCLFFTNQSEQLTIFDDLLCCIMFSIYFFEKLIS